MLKFLSPHFISFVWAIFATFKSIAYYSHEIPSLVEFQASFPLPLWFMWLVVAILCFIGSIPWCRMDRYTRYFRIAGITVASFLLAIKAISFWLGVTDTSWISGVNYFMLAISALVTSTLVGRGHAPSAMEQAVMIPDKRGEKGGVM